MESSFWLNTSHTDFELAGVQISAVILQFLINKKWRPKLHFSSPEPKALSELIGWDSSRRQCVRPCVSLSTLSNMNIFETSRPINIKFHLEHYWGKGLAVLGFGLDQIRTLVSMA